MDIENVHFYLPSMHAYAHGERCQKLFHPKFNPVVGKVDGECSERNWSHLSKVRLL